MFEFIKKSSLIPAQIGLALTFFVAAIACSHEQVRMESMADAVAPVDTVQEQAPPKSLWPQAPDQAQAAPKASHRRHARHAVGNKVAKHIHSKRHKSLKAAPAVARLSEPPQTPNFVPPAPPPPAPVTPAVMLTTPNATSGSEWALWVFGIASFSLVIWGVRSSRLRSSRRNRRGLVYNN